MNGYEPYVELKLIQARQRELEKKLALARLVARTNPGRPGLLARLLPRLGDILIFLGQMLKARGEPGCPLERNATSRLSRRSSAR